MDFQVVSYFVFVLQRIIKENTDLNQLRIPFTNLLCQDLM